MDFTIKNALACNFYFNDCVISFKLRKMNRFFIIIPALIATFVLAFQGASEAQTKIWTLQECLQYAIDNNVSLQKTELATLENEVSRKEAIGAFFPSVSAGISQNYSHRNTGGTWSGSYNLGASMNLFNGLKNYWTLKQVKLQSQITDASINQSKYDLEISVNQCYLQILYYKEALSIAKQNWEVTDKQLQRGQELYDAGSYSKSELATLKSQNSSSYYQMINAENALANMKLQLKQLLELGINDDIDVVDVSIEKEDIMQDLDSKNTIYQRALENMPEMQVAKMNKDLADLNFKMSKAGCYPSLSLSASIGTGNTYNASTSFLEQLSTQFAQSVGISLSIPLFNRLQTYGTIERARIQLKSVDYDYAIAEKNMLKTIEALYQDAVAAQAKFLASEQQLEAAELSYELVLEKFNLGMQNSTDLLVERNNLNAAQQDLLQAKYTALLSQKILNIYQGIK